MNRRGPAMFAALALAALGGTQIPVSSSPSEITPQARAASPSSPRNTPAPAPKPSASGEIAKHIRGGRQHAWRRRARGGRLGWSIPEGKRRARKARNQKRHKAHLKG